MGLVREEGHHFREGSRPPKETVEIHMAIAMGTLEGLSAQQLVSWGPNRFECGAQVAATVPLLWNGKIRDLAKSEGSLCLYKWRLQ